jgi:acyl carrier protein
VTTLAELAALLVEVTGVDAGSVTPAARLDGDLRLDSLELAALAERLRGRYGDRVDLVGYVTGLGLDQIIALTVGDVLAYLDAAGAR